MFGIFKSNKPNNLRTLEDVKALIKSAGAAEAGEVIRKAADAGNVNCQVFLYQSSLHFKDMLNAEKYCKMASDSGDTEAMYNYAKILTNKLDADCEFWSDEDISRIRQIKSLHRKASAKGFAPSKKALKDFASFPDDVF
jgi:hypothetical protein